MKAICNKCGASFNSADGWVGAGPAGDMVLCGPCGRGEFKRHLERCERSRINEAWFLLYDLEQSGRLTPEEVSIVYQARKILSKTGQF